MVDEQTYEEISKHSNSTYPKLHGNGDNLICKLWKKRIYDRRKSRKNL